MSTGVQAETYWDIVWRQFKKNSPAVVSLYLFAPLFAVAIFGPVLASNLPFVYFTPEKTYFPWFRALFNSELSVDIFFNMAMLAFFPCLAAVLVLNVGWSLQGRRWKWRLSRALLVYLGGTLLLLVMFSPYLMWLLRGTLFLVLPSALLGAALYFVVAIVGMRHVAVRLAVAVVGLCVAAPWCAAPLFALARLDDPGANPLRFTYPYKQIDFSKREFLARQELAPDATLQEWGLYPPLPFGPNVSDLEERFKPPLYRKPAELWHEGNDGYTHWLGTDTSGFDLLTQMIYGTRVAMSVGFVAVVIYIIIGTVLGALAGYFGGWVDMLISRAIEVMLLFPAFFLILTVVGLLGPSIFIIMVVIGLTSWPSVARLVRGEVLKQRAIEYVLAAKAQGISDFRIIFRHVLPNSISPVLVTVPFGISSAIITESSLSLLGWGARPPASTWGVLLNQGRDNLECWWLIVVPSVAILFTVTVFNLVGSGLRDAMDPRLRR